MQKSSLFETIDTAIVLAVQYNTIYALFDLQGASISHNIIGNSMPTCPKSKSGDGKKRSKIQRINLKEKRFKEGKLYRIGKF